MSVPIPTNSIPNLPAWIYFSIDSVSNAWWGNPSTVSVQVLDDDTPAITFTTNALTVVETASNVVLTVRRQASAVGAFNANYATVDGTAVAGLRDCKAQSMAATPRCIWNPDIEKRIDYSMMHDAVGYTPYEGHVYQGWPEIVTSRGRVVVEGGALKAARGSGQFLARGRPGPLAAAAAGKIDGPARQLRKLVG